MTELVLDIFDHSLTSHAQKDSEQVEVQEEGALPFLLQSPNHSAADRRSLITRPAPRTRRHPACFRGTQFNRNAA
jgi:hypothetical protein